MIRHLERNERVVSWLQPLGGRVEDQQPAVRFKGHFYTLSLRMMKSIWRHVSLPCLDVRAEHVSLPRLGASSV